MQQDFERVVRAFCQAESIALAEPILQGAVIELDGVEFSLLYDEEQDGDTLQLRVVFGAAPLQDETAIFRMLLQQNHAGYRGRGPGFCLSPASGQVLYLHQIALQQATPALLATTMRYFTGKVKTWRKTFYLVPSLPARRGYSRAVAVSNG